MLKLTLLREDALLLKLMVLDCVERSAVLFDRLGLLADDDGKCWRSWCSENRQLPSKQIRRSTFGSSENPGRLLDDPKVTSSLRHTCQSNSIKWKRNNLHIINLTYCRVELKVVPDDDAHMEERRWGSNDKRVGGRPASGNFPSVMAIAESLEQVQHFLKFWQSTKKSTNEVAAYHCHIG